MVVEAVSAAAPDRVEQHEPNWRISGRRLPHAQSTESTPSRQAGAVPPGEPFGHHTPLYDLDVSRLVQTVHAKPPLFGGEGSIGVRGEGAPVCVAVRRVKATGSDHPVVEPERWCIRRHAVSSVWLWSGMLGRSRGCHLRAYAIAGIPATLPNAPDCGR